jgi:2-isopropylmalate synthase
MKPRRIEIYDTTLRDGTQAEGFSLSVQDKLVITQKLDEVGIDLVEGGFPLSNPKDVEYFREVRSMRLRHARVAAFGMTRKSKSRARDDPGMRAILAAQTPVVTLVGKSIDRQVHNVLRTTLEENLRMIADSVGLMRSAGRQVIYDAEHFFDACRANAEYAMRTLRAAEEAGASVLVLCDTNGGSLPEHIAQVTELVRRQTSARVGIHTHNDAGLALANALAAVRAGADHVQGTINGVGERCGNVDLLAVVANLVLKYKADCLAGGALRRLTEVSRFVYETGNLNLVPSQPYVGSSAFAHKGGMHVHAVARDTTTYEHVRPDAVGNTRKVLVSELSGASNIAVKAGRKFNIENDKAALRKVLNRVQELEHAGYEFEVADASFELVVRKAIGRYRPFFHLDHYRVIILKKDSASPVAEASVKLHVGDVMEHRVAESDGPVGALDAALKKALRDHHPAIQNVHLIDYKVRVVNSREETQAAVRVLVEFRRDLPGGRREIFGTIGVSPNIIDASWQAIVDAYEYHLHHVAEGGR